MPHKFVQIALLPPAVEGDRRTELSERFPLKTQRTENVTENPLAWTLTMGIDDAIRAVEWIQPKVVLPTHYNTWPPIAQDAVRWADLVKQRTRSKPIVLLPGDTYQYNE